MGRLTLSLRPDNADMRLTEIGRKWRAVGDARWSRFLAEKSALETATAALKDIRMSIAKWSRAIPAFQSKNPARGKVAMLAAAFEKF